MYRGSARSVLRLANAPLRQQAYGRGLLAAASVKAPRAYSTTTYRSTRGGQTGLKFDEAVLQGLATDRGLLVPEVIPSFPADAPEKWRGLSFQDLAFEVMSLYIGPNDVPPEKLKDIIARSYGTFRDADVTPTVPICDGMHTLELFHGPTFAFKDVALQFLGNLFEHLLSVRPGKKITVVGATSGDTGSSAIHGLRGKQGIECFIMYPEGRTSRTQELQMISVVDANIHNIALGGTFDDCQATVKACFNDHAFRDAHSLAAVNSINWARILAQMVYYVHAYLKVTATPPTDHAAPRHPPALYPTPPAGASARRSIQRWRATPPRHPVALHHAAAAEAAGAGWLLWGWEPSAGVCDRGSWWWQPVVAAAVASAGRGCASRRRGSEPCGGGSLSREGGRCHGRGGRCHGRVLGAAITCANGVPMGSTGRQGYDPSCRACALDGTVLGCPVCSAASSARSRKHASPLPLSPSPPPLA